MMHDLSITETRVVLYDLPVTFDLEMAMSGTGLPYRWDEDYGARVGVLPKGGTADQVRWYDVEPCYVFHPMNAHDLPDGRIQIDVVRHPSMFRTDLRGPNEGTRRSTAGRSTRPPARSTRNASTTTPLELPRVDERLVGKRARYGYADHVRRRPAGRSQCGPLVRHDLTDGTASVPRLRRRPHHRWRPCSCPGRADAAEDDGWVMSVVYDAATDTSQLVLLNGQDFTGEPACVIQLPEPGAVRLPRQLGRPTGTDPRSQATLGPWSLPSSSPPARDPASTVTTPQAARRPRRSTLLVAHALDAACASGLDVYVVTGAVDVDRPAPGRRVTVVHNPHWADGQAVSVRAGIAAADADGHDAVVVGLGDQPFVTAETWRAVAAADADIAVATYDGARGNPVRLAAGLGRCCHPSGDEVGRALMRNRPELVTEIPCDGDPADIDTLEDLHRWT